MPSEGWNWNPFKDNQLVLPPASTPSGVKTTRHCNTQKRMSVGQATLVQNRSGIRLTTSISGTPTSAKMPWRRRPPKNPAFLR